jgi:hypothetical protein
VSAAAPFQDLPVYPWLPQDTDAVHVTSLLAALTVSWTAVGVRLARRAAASGRPEAVVLHHRGIRAERLSRKGSRVVAEIPWEEVGDAEFRPGPHDLVVTGTRGRTVVATGGADGELRAIEEQVRRRVAPVPERRRPPVVPGWVAYPDDRGATLRQVRGAPFGLAAATAGASVLAGVNAVALAVDPPPMPAVWWGVTLLALGSAGLACAAYGYAVHRPRWVARPGAVVLEVRGPGRGVTFEARSLELVGYTTEDGTRRQRLDALADPVAGPRTGRRAVLTGEVPDATQEAAGAWLARHADIPFRSPAARERS